MNSSKQNTTQSENDHNINKITDVFFFAFFSFISQLYYIRLNNTF